MNTPSCRAVALSVLLLSFLASGDLLAQPQIAGPPQANSIMRLDPRIDKILSKNARLEKIVAGHKWVEGPVWNRQEHYLLYSDIPRNSVFKWQEGKGASLFLKPSGYTGASPFSGAEPGSNGLALDALGRLVLAQHGDRRIARLENDRRFISLVDRYDGKRINSPNDLVFAKNGDLYFTDPPFGLPGAFGDPNKELPFQGVYRLSTKGQLTLVIKDIKAPNGIALSPDEKRLYVSDVNYDRSAWLVYDLQSDGTAASGRVFADAKRWRQPPYFGPDGFKVDREGNLFGARPGGVSIFAPDGVLIGSIEMGHPVSNVAWGKDGSTLFITGGESVYRIRLTTRGVGY